jgi:hypothetical protein
MTSPDPMDISEARVLGTLVNSQLELMWGAAIALIGVELFILLKLYGIDKWGWRIRISLGILFLVIAAHFISLFFGYLATGSVTTMAEWVANEALQAESEKNAWDYFKNAEWEAAWQMLLVFCGFLVFLGIAIVNLGTLARIFDGKESGAAERDEPVPAAVSAVAAAASATAAAQSAQNAAESAETAQNHADAAEAARESADSAATPPQLQRPQSEKGM